LTTSAESEGQYLGWEEWAAPGQGVMALVGSAYRQDGRLATQGECHDV